MTKKQQTSILSKRGGIFVAEIIPALLLVAWTLDAFWEHLGDLKASYGAYLGAAGPESLVLIMVVFSSFAWKIRTRRWALIMGVTIGVLLLIHAGALRGLKAAQAGEEQTAKVLTENLATLNQSQNDSAGRLIRQQGRIVGEGNAVKLSQQTVQKNNNAAVQALTDYAGKTQGRIAEKLFVPRWYLNGGMFSVMFILSLVLSSVVFYMAHNDKDFDRDYDGVEDEFPEEIETVRPNA